MMEKQFHVGTYPKQDNEDKRVFHTNTKGLWWSGFMFDSLTSQELLDMCRSIERDFLRLDHSLK